ncbi:MAG: TonB-dependent receptor plug domain-containing protein [Methylomonas sp.]|jgi:iron complex outermembrane receptor protein|uniref:TonB-dependent receptor n=1 Tax=Methylomonas sp. TaxID=418 RepID=UPI0025F588BC|nr:TonB-dependent receptor plug domain-containing protein [Methylomonas sp.]MCK9607925.1 TonB-dependent receptor plug domain-containing protein [Methylomonas sp.]
MRGRNTYQSLEILSWGKPLLVCLLSLNSLVPALAEENPVELQGTEVIANPIIDENKLDAFSDISAVVSDEQIRDQNAVDLASALRRTPGVQISRFNPVGAFGGNEGGGVFIRGMGNSRPGSEINTYIDGIPLLMGVWGHPLLDFLPVNGMQSITVYKSPQPYLNGNNFASINLETKQVVQDGIHGHGRFSGGYFGTFIEQADITGKQGDLDFSLAQGYSTSNGHRHNADGELKNVMGSVGYRLNQNWKIGSHFLYVNSQAGDPGNIQLAQPTDPRYNTEAGLVSMDLSHQHASVHGDLKLYMNTGRGDWLAYQDPGRGNPTVDTLSDFDMYGLRWKETLAPWRGGELIGGVDSDWTSGGISDVNHSAPANSFSYDTPTFRLTSPFVALNQTFQLSQDWALVPSAGVRYYDHSRFDSESSPHAGISLASDRVTLFANFSRGIHFPGLEVPTLAKYIVPLGDTWRDLRAEEVQHAEFGGKFTPFDGTQIDLSFFNDRVKNRYVFRFFPGAPTFLSLGEYAMRGFEGSFKQDIMQDWSVFAGVTLLDPSINNLPYTPERMVSVGLNGRIEKVRLNFDAQYQSETFTLNRDRNANDSNTQTVASFVVVNARAAYPIPLLGKQGEVFIAAENLLSRDYSYRQGYPMPGRWGQIGISASF